VKPGAVRLRVANLEHARAFYEETVGLRKAVAEFGPTDPSIDGSKGIITAIPEGG
jgi:hypothetical protein